MKVVLFCGGLGTRIREYSENIPKPMIPIGDQPILWHVMQYYSQYGHNDFVLCLGYKANVIKEFFLNYRPTLRRLRRLRASAAMSRCSASTQAGLARHPDRHRHLAQHRRAPVGGAGPRRGRGDVPCQLQRRTYRRRPRRDDRQFKKSGKIGCFLAVRPPLTFHLADIDADGKSRAFRTSDASEIWINGGYFIFRREIFDYMREGEELVLEPFSRLIEDEQLMAYKHEGFWRSMDTLQDRQMLEDMVEQGKMPWRLGDCRPGAASSRDGSAYESRFTLAGPEASRLSAPVPRRALRRHRDRRWRHDPRAACDMASSSTSYWCVLSAGRARARGKPVPLRRLFSSERRKCPFELGQFRDGFFPYQGEDVKCWIED